MSANFLSLVNGIKTLLQAATVSDGTSRIIASNSNGLIDSSFLPVVNSSGNLFFETLTVSAQNTLSNLTHTPTNSTLIKLYVNGKAEFIPSFSISGTAITWSASNSGYNILTGFVVVAEYLI